MVYSVSLFDQFQQAIPYATLAQAIRGLTQLLLASTDEELARWREYLHEAWEGQGQGLVNVVPQLELVVGKQPAVQELPPSEAQQRVNRVFRKFLGSSPPPSTPSSSSWMTCSGPIWAASNSSITCSPTRRHRRGC
jgi:hypothetical protein